jgi:OOP family OmpA-OmpF porin
MISRLVVTVAAAAALLAPSLAAAQLPTSIRQRAIEVGGIGRFTIFNQDDTQLDNVFAGGGRLAYYLLNNLAVEGEVSFGVTETDNIVPGRADTKDVSHTLWDARLLFNTPQRGRTSFHLGAGYGYDGFGRLRNSGVGPRGHGPTGIVGVRFFVTPRVTVRGDVGGLYVVSEDEPRDESNQNNAERENRFEPSIRLGLGILFRNQPTTSVVTQTVARVDTVRINTGPARVDTVYRDRIQQATQSTAAATASGATVVIGVVNFDFDRAEISSDARRILDDIAASMQRPEAQRLRLILTGNTDAIGGESYNNRLSERRAEAVRAYLAGRGITADRLTPRAAGEGNPVASNENPEGRATNRRVLIELNNQ